MESSWTDRPLPCTALKTEYLVAKFSWTVLKRVDRCINTTVGKLKSLSAALLTCTVNIGADSKYTLLKLYYRDSRRDVQVSRQTRAITRAWRSYVIRELHQR